MTTTILNDLENEVVILDSLWDLVDSVVNFEVLLIGPSDPTEIRFNSMTHAKYFNIVLVDLLSATDKQGFVKPTPYIAALRKIVERPNFDAEGSIADLAHATRSFSDWLDTEIRIEKVWLPSASIETDLVITRIQLLKIAGNICRHNVLRAIGVAKEVQSLLEQNRVNIGLDKALLVLTDLYEWLHQDIFYYHSSTIAEFLNNIRWGIYTYLRPEYSRSLVWISRDPPNYKFKIPDGLDAEYAKDCYWALMNKVRRVPYVRRFQVTEWIKRRH